MKNKMSEMSNSQSGLGDQRASRVDQGLAVCKLHLEALQSGLIFDADFSILPDERVALIGPSGSGKSTLLRYMAGFTETFGRQSGGVYLDGVEITDQPVHRRNFGVLFQDPALFSQMSVLENICFGLKLRGVTPQAAEKQAMPWLERLAIQHLANRSVGGLSGGEKSRVAWIRTLIWKPRVLLLDEPWSALDLQLREAMFLQLRQIHEELRIPVLFVSHHAQDVRAIATRVLTLQFEPGSNLRRVVSS